MISAIEKPLGERKTCVRWKFNLIPNAYAAASTSDTENYYSTSTAVRLLYNFFFCLFRPSDANDNLRRGNRIRFRLKFPSTAYSSDVMSKTVRSVDDSGRWEKNNNNNFNGRSSANTHIYFNDEV